MPVGAQQGLEGGVSGSAGGRKVGQVLYMCYSNEMFLMLQMQCLLILSDMLFSDVVVYDI